MITFEQFPHVDQWSGVWAIEEKAFNAQLEAIRQIDFRVHYDTATQQIAADNRAFDGSGMRYTVLEKDGIAIVEVSGVLQKQVASMSRGTSTVLLRRELQELQRDDAVKGVLLVIESPGGTAAGTKELADAVRSLALSKPVHAHIEDLGASAAYWVASQAKRISANEPALVGSIGTYAVVHDLSGKAASEGIKVHVVRAGTRKGVGVPGTEVTAEDLADVQKVVDSRNSIFLRYVSEGRSLSIEKVQELADGRVHPATDAVEMQLIDRVSSIDEALSDLRRAVSINSVSKGKDVKMSNDNQEPKAASLADIKAACEGCSDSFVVGCLEANRTIDQCKDAWIQELATDLAAKNEQIEKTSAAKTSVASLGVDPISQTAGGQAEGAQVHAEARRRERPGHPRP